MEEAIDAYLPTDHHSMIYRDQHNWYHLYVASGANMPWANIGNFAFVPQPVI